MKTMKTNPDDLIHSYDGPDGENTSGLTKREYFALHLASGIISDPDLSIGFAVTNSVEMADKLIEQLNRKRE